MRTHFLCRKEGKEFIVTIGDETHGLRMRDFAHTDKRLAEQLGVGVRDIPRLRKACSVDTSTEIINKMIEAGFVSGKLVGRPDTDIVRAFGQIGLRVGRHRIRAVREKLGIEPVRPSDFRNRHTNWELAHDELRDPSIPHIKIAEQLRISPVSVYRRRKRLVANGDIPESHMSKWGQPGKHARDAD